MLTPEELKALYKGMGYSVLAITDHDILVAHDYLNDEEFITLHGFEMEVGEHKEGVHGTMNKCCHMCSIALEPDNMTQPCWHRTKYTPGIAKELIDAVVFDESKPDFEREYSCEGVSRMMEESRSNGYFVTYNHPSWSRERYTQYMGYNSMHAMEMFNGGCLNAGYLDYNPDVYDDLLRQGKRIYCIGADDNHGSKQEERRLWDFFRAFTMIKSEKLEYGAIIDALDNGNFYASEGPEITELYFEDGKVHIKCSDAAQISLPTGIRKSGIVKAKDGVPVNEAAFAVDESCIYFRLTVTDMNGMHATTNAYFLDEIM